MANGAAEAATTDGGFHGDAALPFVLHCAFMVLVAVLMMHVQVCPLSFPCTVIRPAGKLFVVPAGALPVPFRKGYIVL